MGMWTICGAAVALSAGSLHAETTLADADRTARPPTVTLVQDDCFFGLVKPFMLAVDDPASVYPEILPPREEEGINSGGVNVGLDVNWMSDYVYRGVDQTPPAAGPKRRPVRCRGKLDLRKLPHPFIALFVNVFNSDPISRFEEVRPYLGLDWTIKPFDVAAGFTSYIYPNRKNLDTQEVFASITFDDSVVFHSALRSFRPMFMAHTICGFTTAIISKPGSSTISCSRISA